MKKKILLILLIIVIIASGFGVYLFINKDNKVTESTPKQYELEEYPVENVRFTLNGSSEKDKEITISDIQFVSLINDTQKPKTFKLDIDSKSYINTYGENALLISVMEVKDIRNKKAIEDQMKETAFERISENLLLPSFTVTPNSTKTIAVYIFPALNDDKGEIDNNEGKADISLELKDVTEEKSNSSIMLTEEDKQIFINEVGAKSIQAETVNGYKENGAVKKGLFLMINGGFPGFGDAVEWAKINDYTVDFKSVYEGVSICIDMEDLPYKEGENVKVTYSVFNEIFEGEVLIKHIVNQTKE